MNTTRSTINAAFFVLISLACMGCGKSVTPTTTSDSTLDTGATGLPSGLITATPTPTPVTGTTGGGATIINPTPTPTPVSFPTPTPPASTTPGYVVGAVGGTATQGNIALPDPCRGISGLYGGTCRADAGTSHVEFIIAATPNGACVIANSRSFQPEILLFGPNSAMAPLKGYPGGLALSSTTINVFAPGVFEIKGYNYAGNFWFKCN